MDNEQLTSLALTARDGDPVAVEHFIRPSHPDMWRFAAHLSGDPSSTDDLAPEASPRARTRLLSIARRLAVDRYRAAATPASGQVPR
ncbi:hypothetical protein ACH4VR_25840 [Streptomyces sp. NPDC020883]|uniref:hypothetical protein n=1 Tax=Streptomyces sp. NPDC020883 TaxID=3365099 RepID=UPI0037B53236